MQKNRGFSLVELLIVVAIIGVIAAIAIPSLLAARRASNESSAVSSLRTIGSAEITYLNQTQRTGSFSDLTGAPYRLLDTEWTDGVVRNNYKFTEASVVPTQGKFHFQAYPLADSNGNKSYAIIEDHVIRYMSGTAPLAAGAGTAIGAQ